MVEEISEIPPNFPFIIYGRGVTGDITGSINIFSARYGVGGGNSKNQG